MNAIDLMVQQIREHPETFSGVITRSARTADRFCRTLYEALGLPELRFTDANHWAWAWPDARPQDYFLMVAPTSSAKHFLGCTITGPLLLDIGVEDQYHTAIRVKSRKLIYFDEGSFTIYGTNDTIK